MTNKKNRSSINSIKSLFFEISKKKDGFCLLSFFFYKKIKRMKIFDEVKG